jgi:DNA repair photolyase
MNRLSRDPVRRRDITSGTREWADRNVNCIKGCTNNCRYCYAKTIAKRFGRCTEETWKEMQIRGDIVGKAFGKYPGRIMFPSSHDIVDMPEAKQACFIVMRNLLWAGNELLITTKPRLAVVKGITSEFGRFKSQIQFRFTITSIDDRQLSFWEPNAPNFQERFRSLRHAYAAGFKTSVSIEPFLDRNPRPLVDALSPYVTESIWIGPMNYIPKNGVSGADKARYDEVRRSREVDHLKAIYDDLRQLPRIRFKDSMAIRLGLSRDHCFVRPAVSARGGAKGLDHAVRN